MRKLCACLVLFLLAGASPAKSDYFPPHEPGPWEKVAPESRDWEENGLAAVVDFARASRTSALLVLEGGRMVVEWYQAPDELEQTERYRFTLNARGHPVEDVASMQKSVAALLFGAARAEGAIDFDDTVSGLLGSGWSSLAPEQERRIDMHHLLTMTSGLTDDLAYETEPGTAWRYNSYAYQKLLPALAAAAGEPINPLTDRYLGRVIGLADSKWTERPGMPGLLGLHASARDMARIGLLALRDGKWRERQVVPAEYVQQAFRPSQPFNPAYGLLWWLNERPGLRSDGSRANQLVPNAPKDLVMASGALGRRIYVVPSRDLVVVRLGDQPPHARSFGKRLWELLIEAAPPTQRPEAVANCPLD